MVTVLTSARHGKLYASRVPSPDTGNLAQTTVRLAWKSGDTPSGDNTFVTVTLGGTNGIDHFVHREDVRDRDLTFKETIAEVHFLGDGTTVDLNFHQMGLLLAEVDLFDVSVSQNTHDSAELLDSLQLRIFTIASLSLVLGKLVGVFGEGLLLGVVPVLVEATFDLFVQVLGPHGSEGTETFGCLDVSNQTHHTHGRSLNDRHCLNNLLLVDLSTWFVGLTQDVGHTGLVAHEGGEVAWLGGVVPGKFANSSTVMGCAFAREKSQGSVAWGFELTV